MKDIVELTEQTTCSKCGGLLGVGISVRCEFDTEIDGYIHRHRNGCRRAADHHLIMEVIENAKHTPSPKAEADKGNAIEGEEEAKDKRDLPTVRIHLPRHARTLSPLQ